MLHVKPLNAARLRERDMMRLVAEVVAGSYVLSPTCHPDDLRQLGYVAHLAKGRVEDPHGRLRHFVKRCRTLLADAPAVDTSHMRDPAQREWGAAWSFDAGRLRTELPLHVKKALAA